MWIVAALILPWPYTLGCWGPALISAFFLGQAKEVSE